MTKAGFKKESLVCRKLEKSTFSARSTDSGGLIVLKVYWFIGAQSIFMYEELHRTAIYDMVVGKGIRRKTRCIFTRIQDNSE